MSDMILLNLFEGLRPIAEPRRLPATAQQTVILKAKVAVMNVRGAPLCLGRFCTASTVAARPSVTKQNKTKQKVEYI
jgi:hypothetical protein